MASIYKAQPNERCPYCDAPFAFEAHGVPGDCTFCAECTAVLTFDENHRRVKPTDEQLAAFMANDEVRQVAIKAGVQWILDYKNNRIGG